MFICLLWAKIFRFKLKFAEKWNCKKQHCLKFLSGIFKSFSMFCFYVSEWVGKTIICWRCYQVYGEATFQECFIQKTKILLWPLTKRKDWLCHLLFTSSFIRRRIKWIKIENKDTSVEYFDPQVYFKKMFCCAKPHA